MSNRFDVQEPINLIEWRPKASSGYPGRLFTCGRPGRAIFGQKRVPVPDDVIEGWVKGLPDSGDLHMVSLLGSKADGMSEFGYYPYRSTLEVADKPTWQEWLNAHYGQRLVIHEIPTVDARGIPKEVLGSVRECVLELLKAGRTIVIIDSAGAERTSRVCEGVGFVVRRSAHGWDWS